jgi:hypothetical protein
MPNFHRIPLTSKGVVYLSSQEINRLLLTDLTLYKEALKRGKAFGRAESKKAQYEKKFSHHESQRLNDFLQ